MPTTPTDRLTRAFREGTVAATAIAAAIALAASLSMASYLNRDLLKEVNAATALTERQQAVAADHDAAFAALLDVSRALPSGDAASGVPSPLRARVLALQERLTRLSARLASVPGFADSVAYRDTVPPLQQLPDALLSAGDGAAPAAALEAIEPMARLGRALRRHDEAERLAHQASMIDLRTRTVALTYLMCLLFTLTAALGTHGLLLARRERRTRQGADTARAEADAARQRAEAAGRDKSKFLGMLSHELLTPLQTIVSSMDIIESRGRIDVGDPLFLRLREGTRALRARMSDLVDFAKMSAGRLAVSPRRFRVDRLVEEVLADHEEALLRKDLDVHWEPGAELARPVVTDPRRVRQILDNLVSNAIKYTARGGLTVEAAVDLGLQRLTLEVRDTGVGIAADALAQIFDPFYRVSTTAQLADGSGLGLAVVRSLVDLLGGTLDVESTPGTGSRFVVGLPLQAAVVRAAALPDAGTDVLIVDDAHDVRAVVADVVRSLGFVPSEAGSAGEALRLLGERAFAVVLLDIELPDLSGDEVARRVRAGTGPNRASRLVMLSASHDLGAERTALFDARVDKPVARSQLQAVLATPEREAADLR